MPPNTLLIQSVEQKIITTFKAYQGCTLKQMVEALNAPKKPIVKEFSHHITPSMQSITWKVKEKMINKCWGHLEGVCP